MLHGIGTVPQPMQADKFAGFEGVRLNDLQFTLLEMAGGTLHMANPKVRLTACERHIKSAKCGCSWFAIPNAHLLRPKSLGTNGQVFNLEQVVESFSRVTLATVSGNYLFMNQGTDFLSTSSSQPPNNPHQSP